MKLDAYMRGDRRLAEVNALAERLYARAGLIAHNYQHALWDTNHIIDISESIKYENIALPIAAGLMHDTGVAIGPYKYHSANGGKIVREHLPDIGFRLNETEEIARAVEQHNGLEHTTFTAQILYDGDTLNKAGAHGIQQCALVGVEFKLDLPEMTKRFLPYLEKLVAKGFYTPAARKSDREIGNCTRGGLEVTLAYWKKVDELLRQGDILQDQVLAEAKKFVGIQDEY